MLGRWDTEKKKGKGDGEKLFEVKAGGGKDDSPAKTDDLFLVR